MHQAYRGALELTLGLSCFTPNRPEIRAVLSKVTSLEIILYPSEFVPSAEFWELWPQLEELRQWHTDPSEEKV